MKRKKPDLTPAALARAVGRLGVQAIAIAFIDENGKEHTVWHSGDDSLLMLGAVTTLNQEMAWCRAGGTVIKPLPKRRRKA